MHSQSGKRQGWRVVPGPAVEAEEHRHLHRDRETLKQERARTTTRLKGLLRSQWPEQLEAWRRWEGSPIPAGLRRRLLRGSAHHQLLSEQSAALAAERRAALHTSPETHIEKGRQLLPLRGIGSNGSWVLVREFFGGRACKHRREVGG
jgi:transposase